MHDQVFHQIRRLASVGSSILFALDSQSPALLDLGTVMLHAYWLTDVDEIFSFRYRMTTHFLILHSIEAIRSVL